MKKSKEKTNKIIESDYSFSLYNDRKRTRVIKRWAVLGVFFFILNICFIGAILFHRRIQGPASKPVMLQSAENESKNEKVEKNQKAKPDKKKSTVDKTDKQKRRKAKKRRTGKKQVYLTFDDGPDKNTEKVLNILKEHDVLATFFVNGKEDDFSEKMYKRIIEEGHTLGMHSYTHDYSQIYKSKKAFFQDYRRIKNFLYHVTGVKPKYYRFPGGTSNTLSEVPMQTLVNGLVARGDMYFDWNAMSGDASGKKFTKTQLIHNVLKDVEIHNTSVVLMHDTKDKTAEMLPELLDKLEKMDVDILPIDEETPLVQHVKVKNN